MRDRIVGTTSIVVAAIIFGVMPLVAKIVFNNGGSPISLVFYRFFLPIPLLYFINKRKGIDLSLRKGDFAKLVSISSFGLSAALLLLYFSYNYISTSLGATIFYIYPIFVAIGCVIFYDHKLSRQEILAVILCGLGIFMFLDNVGNINIFGVGLSFLSGLCYAFYMIYFDNSSLKTMEPFKATFYICIISSVVLFVYGRLTTSLVMDLTITEWIFMVVISLLVTVLATVLFQYGIRLIGSQRASIMGTLEPITSVILGVSVFQDQFNAKTFMGFAIILLAVGLSQYGGKIS